MSTDAPATRPDSGTQNKSDEQKKGSRNGRNSDRVQEVDDGSPLVPPKPVKAPDTTAQTELEKKLRGEIDKAEQRLVELGAEIDQARELRAEHGTGVTAMREELKAHRQKIREATKERDDLVEMLKNHSNAQRNQLTKVQRLSKDLKITDPDQIDRMIAELNQKLETSSMDLKEEKQIVYMIKKYSEDKGKIKELMAERELLDAKKAEHDALFAKRQQVGESLNLLRDEDKKIAAMLDAMKAGEGTADGVAPNVKVIALMEEKNKLYDTIKASRAEIKKANTEFRLEIAEYREFQREQASYERKIESREYAKRREEQKAKAEIIKEERKQKDKERKDERRKQEERMAAVAAGHQIFVGGLSIKCSDGELQKYFEKYGKVTDCNVAKEKDTDISRGFGFVTFEAKDDAFAQKSKQQVEWEAQQEKMKKKREEKEARDAAASTPAEEASDAAESKEEVSAPAESKTEVKEEMSVAEPAATEEVAVAQPEESNVAVTEPEGAVDGGHSASNGTSEPNGKAPVVADDAPIAAAEVVTKEDAPVGGEGDSSQEDAMDENSDGKKGWKATRTDWIDKEDMDANAANGDLRIPL